MDRSGTILSARSLLEHTVFAEMMDIGCYTEGCQRSVDDKTNHAIQSVDGSFTPQCMLASPSTPGSGLLASPCLTENMVMVAGETCCRVTDMYFGAVIV